MYYCINFLLSDLIIKTVIPKLLDNLDETKDLYTRHGSLVAVGGSIIGLADSIKKEAKSLQQCFGKKTNFSLQWSTEAGKIPKYRSFGILTESNNTESHS